MTTPLRDRLADELAAVPLAGEDLTAATIARGHRRLRARRLLAAGAATAVVAAGGVGAGQVLTPDRPLVSDRTDAPSREAVRAEWDARVIALLDDARPADFGPVRRDLAGPSLQFLGGGPRGEVAYNLSADVDSTVPRATCADVAEAMECREVAVPGGVAAVVRDVHADLPDLPAVSMVVIEVAGARGLLNVVETLPGEAQWSLADLTELATDPALGEAVAFAAEHDAELRDYATYGPQR